MTASEAARETWQRLSELAGLMRDYHALERRAEHQCAQRDHLQARADLPSTAAERGDR